MSQSTAYTRPFRREALAQRKPTHFNLEPSAGERAGIAAALGLIELPSVRLLGEIRPRGRADFELTARLEAEVVQACIVTLAPVRTRIDEPVRRLFLADWQEPEGEEMEMPEDDGAEPLGPVIDAGFVLTEALALALPLYPRAAGAEFTGHIAAEPGAVPLTDEQLRPFSGLADLLKGNRKPD
jgi:uncharacterized metal-binding protein YceD (DUF177 family)